MFPGQRNVLLLAISQALMLSAIVMAMALGAILGNTLAPDKSLATLPIVLMVIGTALTSLPAALLMRRTGRRAGFLLGTLLGVGGSLASAFALWTGSFAWFAAGYFLLGAYQGFGSYYRFAAVEATEPAHSSRAISLVVAAGIIAAFLGPQLGQWGREWLAGGFFVGSYIAQGILSLVAFVLLSQLSLPSVNIAQDGEARPLSEILSQPALRISVLGASIGYAVMIMVMTATPLAMLGCGLPRTDVTPVIQWHVVGMFAPSFFTGTLIKRWGALRIMQAGFILLLIHVALALSGIEFLYFLSGLIFLGIGWNLRLYRRNGAIDPDLPACRAVEGAGGQRVHHFRAGGICHTVGGLAVRPFRVGALERLRPAAVVHCIDFGPTPGAQAACGCSGGGIAITVNDF